MTIVSARALNESRELADALAWITANASNVDDVEADVRAEIDLLRRMQLLSACVPPTFGGQALGFSSQAGEIRQAFEILRRIGHASLPTARLFEGHVNAVKLVALYGSDATQRDIFARVLDGALLGVWGADGQRPLTYDGVGGVLHLSGTKSFASGLGLVSHAVVTMRRANGTAPSQLAIVDVSDGGRQDRSVWKVSGMRATQSGAFDFSGLSVCRENLLGRPGAYEQEPHFEGGVWRYCAVHIGGVQALIDQTLVVAEGRRRLDDPLQLSRLARAVAMVRSAAALGRECCVQVESADRNADQPESSPAIVAAGALLLRQVVEDVCVEVMQICEKSLGTAAHIAGSPVERIRRDLSLFIRQAAPDSKLLNAARCLLLSSGARTSLW